MRILTVRQPWAWAIIHGGKDVENRVRNIAGAYRGPVAIHAGLALDLEAIKASDRIHGPLHWAFRRASARLQEGIPPWRGWFGHIIGVVDLVDVHSLTETAGRRHCTTVPAPRELGESGACSTWAEPDAWHLELANPRPLADPIPYRGALGLRTLDDDTTARILAQIGAPS